jgi:hypothetical protein
MGICSSLDIARSLSLPAELYSEEPLKGSRPWIIHEVRYPAGKWPLNPLIVADHPGLGAARDAVAQLLKTGPRRA